MERLASQERLATVVAVIAIGLALSLMINPPLVWGFLLLLVATTCVGTSHVLRAPDRPERSDLTLAVYVLPSLIVVGGFLFLRLPFLSHGAVVALGLILTAALLAAALYAEDQTADPTSPRYGRARLILNLIAWVIAFALFSAIFAPKIRSIVSASAVLTASALIAAELFRGAGRVRSHGIYVAVVALTLGQVTWALNYWVLSALTGGAILLLVFYTVTGIVRSHLDGTLGSTVLSEHLAVAGVGLVAIVVGGLWLR